MKAIIFLLLFFLLGSPISAQCYMDRHSTNAHDGWISCEPSMSPNANLSQGHWILYDLGAVHTVYDLQIWNQNHPEMNDFGIKDLQIDYSADSISWVTHDTFTLPRAMGISTYEGYMGIDLNGVATRYILLTGLSNYGGACYSLSEIRIFINDQQPVEFNLPLTVCENEGVQMNLSGGFEDGGIYSGPGITDEGDGTFTLDPDLLGPGEYVVDYNSSSLNLSTQFTVLPCYDDACQDCIECNGYLQEDVDASPIDANVYHGDTLVSQGIVSMSQDVEFRANRSITLLEGFEVGSETEFMAWIRACQINQFQNFGFENGSEDWTFHFNSNFNGSASFDIVPESFSGDSALLVRVDQVHITEMGGVEGWRLQLRQSLASLEAGRTYEISFAIKSDGQRQVRTRIRQTQNGSQTLFQEDLIAKPYWEMKKMRFTAEDNYTDNARLDLWLGYEEGSFWIDHLRFVVVQE